MERKFVRAYDICLLLFQKFKERNRSGFDLCDAVILPANRLSSYLSLLEVNIFTFIILAYKHPHLKTLRLPSLWYIIHECHNRSNYDNC